MIICPKCNKQLEDGSLFCDACGEKIVAQQAPAAEAAPAAAQAKPALDIKKIAILGGAAVAVVLVLVLLGSLIFGGGKPDYALYIKDGELQYSNFDKVIEVTDDLYGEAGNQQLSGMGTSLGYYSLLTDDGNKLFYIDKISNGEHTLYCRDIKNPKNDPIKIDTNISGYMVNQKGDLVTYIKYDGEESILYQHNLKDKTKIKGKIDDFVASLDGKNILYKNEEGNLYLKKGNKDEEKIASEIEDILYVNKDLSKIYYTKEGSLYLKDGSKDVVKVVSDVAEVYKIYDNGKFYYVESKEEEETNEGGDGPVVDERAITADAAGSAIDSFIEERTSVLYFYNGKEKVKLTDAYFGSRVYSVEKQVLAYSVLNADEIDEETMDVSKAVEWYIAVEGNATKINVENISKVRVARDGKTAYVMSVEPVTVTEPTEGEEAEVKEPTGDIYKIKISSKAESPEKLDSDVYAGSMIITSHGNVIYYKEVKNGEGELYIDKTKIDDEVKVDSVQYLKDAKKVVYYSDYNSEKGHGTLEIATLKGKTTKIADDVKTFVVNPKEDILYINDYSATTYKGTLYRFSGNKSKKVDEDVVAIVGYESFTDLVAKEYGWID